MSKERNYTSDQVRETILNHTAEPKKPQVLFERMAEHPYDEQDVRTALWHLIYMGDLELSLDWKVGAQAPHLRQLDFLEEIE